MRILPDWPAPNHIKAFTTLRDTWQDKSSIVAPFQLPVAPIWLKQVHGINVVRACPENLDKEADASFTDQQKHICVVLTADCLPLLITNRKGTHVAAIHAGWRGLAAGIIEATLDKLSLPSNDLLVWLGPAIGPEKFEVGDDVYQAFLSNYPQSTKAFVPHAEGKWLANLYELAKICLALKGVSHVYGGEFCTYTQNHLFHSYRRDKNAAGRLASLIWIENSYQ